MYYPRISPAIIAILLCTFVFQNCSDETTSPTGHIVTGKIVDPDDLPIAGIKIKIGSSSTLSSSDGSFRFENVSFPFDLSLIDLMHKRYFLYKGLSASDLKIPNYYYSPASWHVGILNVSVPSEILPQGTKGKIIFTSESNVYLIQDLQLNNLMNVTLPELDRNYEGKLVILTYTTDGAGNILTYEKFSESENISINAYSNLSYHFQPSQFSLNLSQKNVSGTITHPAGFTTTNCFYQFAFTTKKLNIISTDIIFSHINDMFNFPVPSNLPLEFSIIVSNENSDGNASSFESYKLDEHSQGVNLTTKIPPALIFPPDNAEGINGSSVFSYNSGDGEGVFELLFFDITDNSAFDVITTSNNFNFSEIIALTEEDISNDIFTWFTGKRGQFRDVNEYMTSFYESQSYFGTSSEFRYFKVE